MAKHTPEAARLTDMILETFRLNGRLLSAGDQLIGDLGLSSARWQVMGALDSAALPVAQIARNMGLTRQAVQRVANELAREGIVEFAENPNHRRAKLARLTAAGTATLAEVTRRQIDWSNRLAKELSAAEIDAALAVVREIRERLDRDKS